MKGNVPESGQSFDVTEADIFIANIAENSNSLTCDAVFVGKAVSFSDSGGDRGWSSAINPGGYNSGLCCFVEDLENAFARRASGLDKLVQLMQSADRIIEKCCQH